MSPEERMALQGVVVEYLQSRAQEQPTLLVDTLLSGDGYSLLYQVLSKLSLEARQRAGALGHLLQLLMTERGIATGAIRSRPNEGPSIPPEPPPGPLPADGGQE